jgi:sRNA-binding carbon storage regulator CsrA
MNKAGTSILINDDEVEFKVIHVFSAKSKKMRKYTVDRAERIGSIQVDSESIKIGGDIYSKSITLNKNNLKLCLSTKRNGK